MKKIFLTAVVFMASMSMSVFANGKNITEMQLCKDASIAAESQKSFTLPPKEANKRYLLKVTSRQEFHTFGGFSYKMQMTLNGNPLDAKMDRKTDILVNRPPSFVYSQKEFFWNNGDGIWLSIFSDSFDRNPQGIAGKDPYTYTLDVSTLLNAKDANSFNIVNLHTKNKEEGKETALIVSVDLIIEQMNNADSVNTTTASLCLSGKPELEVSPHGAFAIKIGDLKLPFVSQFSHPGGGWNYFSTENKASADDLWKIQNEKNGSNNYTIRAEDKNYIIKRTLSLHENRVSIKDEFTNKNNEPVGIRFTNQLAFGNMPFNMCVMGGLNSQSLNNYFSPDNSTLFYPLEKSSLGIAIEDDVARNQSLLFFDGKNNTTGMSDDLFCLDAKASYSVEWSVYLMKSGDYYDFINQVRKEWAANFTIPGPFYFVNYNWILSMPEEKLKVLLEEKDAKYITFWEMRTEKLPEWNNKYSNCMGTAIFAPEFKEETLKVKKAIEKLHKIKPEIKVTLYTHCFFQGLEKPDDPAFKDSWVTDKSGSRAKSVYDNVYPCVNYQPVFPTLKNSYGKAFDKILDYYFDTLKVDWLYWDESTGPGLTAQNNKSASNLTYNAWDGNSAEIDLKTNMIIKKFAILPLICKDYISAKIKMAKDRNGLILFNGAAVTRDRIDSLCMAETQDTISRSYMTHLNTPLAYGNNKPTMEDIRKRLDLGVLYLRGHFDSPSLAVNKFFPFTPIEMHKGWLKGKERIITKDNGTFGWQGEFKGKIWVFDRDGQMQDGNPQIKSYIDSVIINVPDGGISIFERTDI